MGRVEYRAELGLVGGCLVAESIPWKADRAEAVVIADMAINT